MYVNVNDGERLDSGETAKTTTRRRFLGEISFLYRHDNVYTCPGPGIFVGSGGGGGGGCQARMTGKSLDVFFSSSFVLKGLNSFCRGSPFQRKLSSNNFPMFHGEGRYNISGGGPTFPKGWVSNCILLYIPCDFTGDGVWTPCPLLWSRAWHR